MIFGVDLRASPKLPSAVVALDDGAHLSFLSNFSDDSELFQMGETHQPSLIAIGAPLSLPTGLCCLETPCSCQTITPQKKGRQAELELSRMGISCFFTNKRSIIRTLIYRGIDISRKLTEQGHTVIEVYPHATKPPVGRQDNPLWRQSASEKQPRQFAFHERQPHAFGEGAGQTRGRVGP